jgi:RimJ/RimL family protein N-acetyltransferase
MTATAGVPETFVTDRLRAERLRAAHFDEVHRMHCEPDVMAHLGGVRTIEQTTEYFNRNMRHWDEYGFGLWILHERTRDGVIGRGLLRHRLVEGVDEIEVGYAFYPAFWGRGLATEITSTCLGFARDGLEVETIVAVTAASNLASQRVLLKNGLAYEREISLDGVMWSLFRRRWEL